MLSRATLLAAPLVGRTTVAAATTTGAVRTAVTGTAFDPREKAAEVREGERRGGGMSRWESSGKRKVCRLCGLPYPLRLAPRGGGTARDCVRGQVCVRSPARAHTRPVKKKKRGHTALATRAVAPLLAPRLS